MARPLSQQHTRYIVIGLLVLLAVLGWGMYLTVKSGYDAQQARFNQERAEFTGRVGDLERTLEDERATSSSRIAGLEDTLEIERAAAGDLAALEAQIESARSELNRRMTALGGREQDLAAVEAALSDAQSQLAALEQQRDGRANRLNQRIKVLG